MSEQRPSSSSDAARERVQARVRLLTDDERLCEALRLHDEFVALQSLFVDVSLTPAKQAEPSGGTVG